MNKRSFKALLSALLAVVMMLGIVPMAVMAEGTTATAITSADQLVTGQYVIATKATNMAMGKYDNGWVLATEVAPATGVLNNVAADLIWTVTVDGTSVVLTDAAGTKIAPKGGNNNGIKNTDTEYKWTVSFADGAFTFAGVGTDTVALASNKGSSGRFRAYKNGTISGNPSSYPSTFVLYKVADTTTPDPDPTPDTSEVVVPATLAEQIAAAGALANGEYLPYESTITGTVGDDLQASNRVEGTYKFTVSDGTNSILCYWTPVTGGTPAKGDTVTVTGKLTAYNGSAQFDSTATATWVSAGEGEDTPDPVVLTPNAQSVVPVAGTAYKMYFIQVNKDDAVYYVTGAMNGYYMATSTVANDGADFFIEATEGGFYLYCMVGETKTYVNVVKSGNYTNTKYETTASTVYTVDETGKTVIATLADGSYIFGTKADGTFTTLGPMAIDSGCMYAQFVTSESVKEEEVVIYETPAEILDAAYALEAGETLSGGHKYTLTGVIVSVDDPYSEQYKNVTVTIKVDGTDKTIVVFRVKGEGADTIKVGDTITVTGTIVNYQGTVEFNSGCTLDEVVPATPDPVPTGDALTVMIAVSVIALAAVAIVISKKRSYQN